MQCDSSGREITSPFAGTPAFGRSKSRDTQTIEEPLDGVVVTPSASPPDLFDTDGTRPQLVSCAAQAADPLCCGSSTESVDQHGGIEKQAPQRSARASGIRMALGADPAGRIIVPLVAVRLDRSQRQFDLVPTPLVVQSAPNQLLDESAPSAGACTTIQLAHELVVELYVHSHVRNYTHVSQGIPPGLPRGAVRCGCCQAQALCST